MPIADDWDIDYVNKIIQHVDGVLAYDGNTGTAPALGDYVRGTTSGAIGKVIGGSDLGGTAATGTLTLTNVVGKIEDDDPLEIMSEVPFDTVTNSGFTIGTALDDGATAAITVRAIEYNLGATAGEGTIYGDTFTAGFANNDNIEDGTTVVALVNGSEVDNSAATFDALANGEMDPAGTATTNDSVIIHYDGGTIDIPEDARIADATSTAFGFAQKVIGVTATGSVRLVDSDTSGGAWTNNNTINIEQVVFYDNQVAGQVFNVGDVVVGSQSGATGRILAIIDDGDSTGKLILADETGSWDDGTSPGPTVDDIQVDGVTIAEVENLTVILAAATLNLPGGVRTEQRGDDQGGLLDTAVSLNIVRSTNALYTYLQDTFDELGQMDDQVPMSAQVLDQVYTLINGWKIPDLSFRFLEKGSLRDEGNNNIFVNIQTVGTIADITDDGYLATATNPTPQPNVYVEQNDVVLRQDWLEGNVDILTKVKTNSDVTLIDGSVPALGVNIDGGILTVYAREFLRTYDNFQFTNTTGGVAVTPLATADDLNNNTGTHEISYTGAGGFTVGEEIVGGTTGARGVVTAEDTTADDLDYVLKSSVQFGSAETITGSVSGATCTFSSVATLVAGYSADIKVMIIEQQATGGSTTGTFIIGEPVSQATTGATGSILEDDGGTLYLEVDDGSVQFSGANLVTGGTSAATNTPSSYTDPQVTVPKDIGDGSGDLNYKAVISADITGMNAQSILNVYEWCKYITRKEAITTIEGVGSDVKREGRIYRLLDTTFAEVKASPFGTFAGGVMFGATGVFIDKDTLIAADLQNIQLIDNAGTTVNPPNLQILEVTGLVTGDTVAVYRTPGVGQSTILRTEFDVGVVGSGNNEAADSTILVGANTRTVSPLPSDVPDTGYLRVEDPNLADTYLRFVYDSVNRTTNIFSLQQGIGQNTIGDVSSATNLTLDENVHVVFISEVASGTSASNTIQYVADIPLLIRVRTKGIIPFETTANFTSTGASVGAIRQADTIVNLP